MPISNLKRQTRSNAESHKIKKSSVRYQLNYQQGKKAYLQQNHNTALMKLMAHVKRQLAVQGWESNSPYKLYCSISLRVPQIRKWLELPLV